MPQWVGYDNGTRLFCSKEQKYVKKKDAKRNGRGQYRCPDCNKQLRAGPRDKT